MFQNKKIFNLKNYFVSMSVESPIFPLIHQYTRSIYQQFPLSLLPQVSIYGDVILVSALCCEIIYLASDWVFKNNSYYKKLDQWQKTNCSLHFVSFVVTTWIPILLFPTRNAEEFIKDRLFGTSHFNCIINAIACGYFLWDIFTSIYFAKYQGSLFIIHGFASFIPILISFQPFAQGYGPYILAFEGSTPFVNIHWFCDKLGLTGSTFQAINGLLLMISFFFFRIWMGTYALVTAVSTYFTVNI
jgi:hypothetical protein